MAPEVIQQSGYDFKADVWSLGITAMELVRGEPPHAGKHPMKVLMEIPKLPAPRLEGNQFSKEFKDFVAKCLIKDPDLRPSAKELLKHKFIKGAGRTEALQELILRRQEWEAGLEKKGAPKYYAETLRNIKVPVVSTDEDDWVFDTVKAVPAVHHTQKRRKISETKVESGVMQHEDSEPEEVDLFQDRQPSTMRRIPEAPSPPRLPSTTKRSTRKRVSSGLQKQPLGVNMSFGNSPSTVRQFRRVSPNEVENDSPAKVQSVAHSSAQSSLTPSKIRNTANSKPSENMPPPPLPDRKSTIPVSDRGSIASSSRPEAPSRTHSSSNTSKEATLGRLIYSSTVGPTCQEILNNTADYAKREALARLAEAFSDLEVADPEGVYHVMNTMLEKMGKNYELIGLVTQALPRSSSQEKGAAGAKLMLAQNNPHLKSHHRRRQSVQSQPAASPGMQQQQPMSPRHRHSAVHNVSAGQVTGSPRSAAAMREAREARDEDRKLRELMPGFDRDVPGQGGLDHENSLADVLFERWSEGLRSRWGGAGQDL